jgi:Uncharacterized protein conserved in bacteria
MNEKTPQQTCAIFYVSDGTGITAETVGQSLITQFPQHIKFMQKRIPFVDTEAKAEQAADLIRQAQADFQPLVINTVVDINLRKIIHAAGGLKTGPFLINCSVKLKKIWVLNAVPVSVGPMACLTATPTMPALMRPILPWLMMMV